MRSRFKTPRSGYVDRIEYLIEQSRSKRVLHLGCSDWPMTEEKIAGHALLHDRLAQAAQTLTGLDASPEGVELLRHNGYADCFVANVEKMDVPELNGRVFDVIIAGELIEHLSNPGLFLQQVRRFMTPETALIITTPNAYCLFRVLRYFFGLEMVHEDHNFYFSPRVLEHLLVQNGMRVVEQKYYGIGPEIRGLIPYRYVLLDQIARRLSPAMSDGLIFKVTRTE